MKTCLQFLIELNKVCHFQTIEGAKVGPVSNSEFRRWFQSKCVEINGVLVAHDDPLPPYIGRMVLFPKNERKRTTLFWDDNFHIITIDEKILEQVRAERCQTCNGHGLIGGSMGQTPESFEQVTLPCPDCNT